MSRAKGFFVILLLSSLSSSLLAKDFFFHVDSPTMVDVYWNIFNAIVALFKNETYIMAMKLVFLIGGLITFIMGVVRTGEDGSHRGMFDFTKYLIGGVAIMLVLGFNSSPTSGNGVSADSTRHPSRLVIMSDTLHTYCKTDIGQDDSHIAQQQPTLGAVVNGVPETLAWGFTFFNKIGTETTKLARMAFSSTGSVGNKDLFQASLSDYAAYLQNIKNVLSISINDIEAAAKTSSVFATSGHQSKMTVSELSKAVWNQCVFVPASNDPNFGPAVMETFLKSGDLKRTLQDYLNGSLKIYKNPKDTNPDVVLDAGLKINGTEPGRIMATSFGTTYLCSDLINDFLNALAVLQDKDIFCVPELKSVDKKTMAILTGSAFSPDTIEPSYAKQIIIQAGLANQVFDARRNIAMGELPYATGKSIAEFTLNSLGTGYYMAKMIPYVQAGMRAILYAFFPFVFLVVLLPGGLKVLVNYLQTLLWIELWAPTAAILDMFLSFMSSEPFQSMFKESGMNYLNATQAFSDASMMASVAGYLYASVPALTWLILKGSGFMLGNITSSIGAVMTKNMDSNVVDMDRSTVESNMRINQIQKLKGLNEIGIAQQTQLLSRAAGAAIAGRYLAYDEAGLERIQKKAYGETMEGLATGMGAAESLQSKEDLDNFAKQKQVEIEKLKQMGRIFTSEGKEKLESLAKGVATKNVADMTSEEKLVKKLMDHWHLDPNKEEDVKKFVEKVGDAKSFQNAVNVVTQETMSKNIDAGTAGIARGAANLGELAKVAEQLNQLGHAAGVGDIVDSEGFHADRFGKVKNYYEKQGIDQAANMEAISRIVDSVGGGKLADAYTAKMAEQVGQALGTPEKIEKQLETYKQYTDAQTRAKISRLQKDLHSKDAEKRNKALVAAAALLTPTGAKGEMFNRLQSDAKAILSGTYGFSPSSLARLSLAQLLKSKEGINAYAEGLMQDRITRGMMAEEAAKEGLLRMRDSHGRTLSKEKEEEIAKEINEKLGTNFKAEEINEETLLKLDASQQAQFREIVDKHGVKLASLDDLSQNTRNKIAMKVGGEMLGTAQQRSEAVNYFNTLMKRNILSTLEEGQARSLIETKGLAFSAEFSKIQEPIKAAMKHLDAYKNMSEKELDQKAQEIVGTIAYMYGIASSAGNMSGAMARNLFHILRTTKLFKDKNTYQILVRLQNANNAQARAAVTMVNNALSTLQRRAGVRPTGINMWSQTPPRGGGINPLSPKNP